MTQSLIGRNMLIEQVLRLFHFLIKFGYYSPDDIKNLLKPLINLLNGKNDKPFLPDAEKGSYSKESHKTVLAFKTKDRFEANINAEAIVNAKFQALEVLDLLFTFQFNTRLECFIAKFKTAELTTINKKSKFQSALCPLLEESFDAFDQSKSSIAIQKKAVKELKNMFDFTAYFDSEQITSILMDLTYYKYDKMVNKALALMNKFYSAKTKLFKSAVQAMVLITSDSCHVHREIARTMPILRRFSKAKLNEDQVKSLGAVLDRYTEYAAFFFVILQLQSSKMTIIPGRLKKM
ncbi:hypothetical protein HELRODRAFT_162844 [Helobdella robusta]|uniref:Uncharacterized protein n=1 Tax=Helobdella robusta TaxID=6412 RepID=T1ET93_HELRO|nr:hypothetical protein HELRODRAFT_162844 [Helobdella robusta]ESN99321.1 hypothetical protein HELRODRAFT_162844 [Helobdella robusta]